MTVPACIQKIFDSKAICPKVIDASTQTKITELRHCAGDAQLATMVLLETNGSKLQAIISTNTLLNLDTLNDLTGHQVSAISAETREQILAGKGLETLPAIPDVTGYTTYIEPLLLEAKTIYLESGKQGAMIKIPSTDFVRLTEASLHAEIGIALADISPLSQNRDQDSTDIYAAIRSYTSLQIKKRLSDTLEIPPLSATAKKILEISNDPNAEIEDLAKAIEMDPGLAAQVVGWAASPYYSAPGKVESIKDAVLRVLGFEMVLNLALGLAMGQSLDVPKTGPGAVTLFWRQSIYCALTMEKLNRRVPAEKRGKPGYAYLAGLMNNFGYLILNHVFPSHFKTLCQYKQANPHINSAIIEQHLLGITGEQMSAQVAEAWSLPIEINNAIRFQQDASYDGADALYANLCYVSRHLLADIGIGNLPGESIPETLLAKLELDPAEIAEELQSLNESQHEIDIMLSSLAA